MYRAAIAHKESIATTNQTSARPNPVSHLAASPRSGCAFANVGFIGETSFLKTSRVFVVAFSFSLEVIDWFLK